MPINLTEYLKSEGIVKSLDVNTNLKSVMYSNQEVKLNNLSDIHFIITNTGNKKLHIEYNFSYQLKLQCDRCLEEVTREFHVADSKDIDFHDTEEDRINDLDEMSFIKGYELDAGSLVQDEVILHLPMKVLCVNDCKGICSICGTNLNRNECECDKAVLDPRMAGILDIFNNSKKKDREV